MGGTQQFGRSRICVSSRRRICVSGDAYAGSTKLLMESNIRARTNHINEAVNFNQLMGFDNDGLTQSILEDYLMTAMEMNDPHYNGVNIN